MIPDEFDIPTTDLYVEGGISGNFTVIKDKYVQIPMDFSLQNHSVKVNRTNDVNFGPFVDSGYQAQIYLTDYLLQSAISAIYSPNMNLTR